MGKESFQYANAGKVAVYTLDVNEQLIRQGHQALRLEPAPKAPQSTRPTGMADG